MTIEDALPTFADLDELNGFLDAARLAGDTFTTEQWGLIASRKIELQKELF